MTTKKQPLLLFIFFGLILLFTQCNCAENENVSILKTTESGLTTITGFVHNRNMFPNTQDITIYVSHISGRERVTQIRTPLNDDGTFLFYIDLARPQDVTMQTFIDFLYLIPGDSLHAELDFANLLDVRLSGGRSADINNDFIRYFNATGFRFDRNHHVGTSILRDASWAEIEESLNRQRDENRNRRQTFLQNNEVHDEVRYLTEAMIELDYYRALRHAVWYRNFHHMETIDKNLLMSKMNDVAERFFHSGIYSNAHFAFIAFAYTQAAASVTENWEYFEDFAAWAEKVAVNDIIRNFMLTVRAGAALLERDLESFGAVAQHINNYYLLDRVMQEFRTTRMNMLNPELISSYILHGGSREFALNLTLNGSPLANLMRERGTGNVQVISVNAVWCAPCRASMPLYSQLIREYADKDVTFTFVSFGDCEASRRMFTDNGIPLSLVHFATDEEVNFFMRTFTPFGLPLGFLINRNGVIVDFGGHVRPGTRLRENIDLLLKQDNLVR